MLFFSEGGNARIFLDFQISYMIIETSFLAKISTRVTDPPNFWPYVLLFSRRFWPRLVQGFQNLLILTLGIFEVLISVQNVKMFQCPGLAGCRPARFLAICPYVFKTFLAAAGPALSKSADSDFRHF